MENDAALRSIAAAVRQVLNQLGRLLEENDARDLLSEKGAFMAALGSWREVVDTQTSGVSVERARQIETEKLLLMGEVGALKKLSADLKETNAHLREELVRLNKKEQEHKQTLLEAQFAGSGARAEAKTLDLEVRDLRRKVRELEGGPPLSPAEAAPKSLDKLNALFKTPDPASSTNTKPAADDPQAAFAAALEQEALKAKPRPETKEESKVRNPKPRKPRKTKKAPAKKAATKKAKKAPANKGAATKKAPAKKAAAKKTATKKAAANKAPKKVQATAKATATKKAATKKAPKKAAAKKARAKKASAKKAPAKKLTTGKPAPRRAPVKPARKKAARKTA